MSNKPISKSLLAQARKTGVLNLTSRNWTDIPEDLWILNTEASREAKSFDSDSNWWDQVELTKLNLSSNAIQTISESLKNFHALVQLDFHDNQLICIPACIGKLQQLKNIDFSRNRIENLPASLFTLPNLVQMKLHHNNIQDVPEGIGNLNSIQALELSHNKIKYLPDTVGNMSGLKKIDISHNYLKKLPVSLTSLSSLFILDASNNHLAEIPETFNCATLSLLFLTNNKLENIPILQECVKLAELYLGNNQIKVVKIDNFPKGIKILELCDNKISLIGDDITSLSHLERLNVANNEISSLPPKLGAMDYIKSVVVDGNPLKTIRHEIIKKGTQELLRYLRTRISDKEDCAGTFKKPVVLSTHDVKVTKTINCGKQHLGLDGVNESLRMAEGLAVSTLILSENLLQEIPNNVFNFSESLLSLNLSKNKLTDIASVCSFKQLTHLDVSSNILSSLPSEISNLIHLIELNISMNRFSSIPACISLITSLEHLLASGNSITQVNPEDLAGLINLSTLALQNNSISQVKPEIASLPKLKILQLEGNLFRVPRQSILQQGPAAVIEYLRSRIPA